MLPFVKQIQIATDHARGAASRLSGQEPPRWADDERTFDDLHARIAKTIDHVKSFQREQFEGWENRDVELKFPSVSFRFTGRDYLLNFAVPNFYFHYTTAYLILRHNGVQIGKRDYLG